MTAPVRSGIDRLLRPESVAIVGASADAGKTAGRPLRLLREGGYAGEIWPVNPRREGIGGVTCYPDIAALPGAPDTAIVLVGPEAAERAVAELAAAGAGAAIVVGSGYAEAGAAGVARQRRLAAAAGSMRLLGPNTIGVVNLVDGVTLSASGALDGEMPAAGRIAIVSQSGGILGSLLSRAAARGVGLSRLVATGNEADLEVSDIVEHLLGDPATSVIALYLETLRDADRFRAVAAGATGQGKTLVVYKVGRSAPGARSAQSHTGALAGEDRLYDALFRRIGAIRVHRYDDLIDVAAALASGRRLAGRRLAVLTHTGGAGGLLADVCGLAGFDTPVPGPETVSRLTGLLSHDGFAADRNPIDLTLAGLDPDVVRGAVSTLVESADFDGVITVVGSSGVGRPDLVAAPVIEIATAATKPLFVYASPSAPVIVRRLNTAGVPAFATPEGCAAAIDAAYRAGLPARGAVARPVPDADPSFDDLSGVLDEAASKRLFAAHGIPVVREATACDAAEAGRLAADIGSELVVKVLSRGLVHKSEISGVRVGIAAADVPAACDEMAAAARMHGVAPIDGFLVQERVIGGIEMLLGFVRDPQIGPAIVLGAGGIAAEIYDDTAIRLPPLDPSEVAEMLGELRIGTLLRGFRGAPPCDLPALTDAVLAFDHMCAALGDRLVEAEINPVFVLPEGLGVKAADGFAVLGARTS